MCDYFSRRMQNNQGELADIVRAISRGVGLQSSPNMELPVINTDQWQQIPSDPLTFSTMNSADFGDPFINFKDPLLHELTGAQLFSSSAQATENNITVGLVEQNVELDGDNNEENDGVNKSCNDSNENVLSRVLQISDGGVKVRPPPLALRAIKPSPVMVSSMMKMSSGSVMEHGVQISSPRTPGIKRRKNQVKKVVCIPAPATASNRPTTGEVVPSDLWAWRKYGQKPIKGSPYPRGYYRCSSSKGCSARKQVERSRTDPNMLVITYTSEHNHPWPTQRNALAGSTRSNPSKNNSKNSNINSLKSSTAIKEEQSVDTSSSAAPQKQQVTDIQKAISTDEDNEFDQVFDETSYKAMKPEVCGQVEDFFADLTELDDDPMSLIFTKEFSTETNKEEEEEKDEKSMDTIFNNLYWSGSAI